MTESSKLNRQELLDTKNPGIHVVDQPLTGFKKIHCDCDPVPRGFWPFIFQTKTKQIDAIAELEIPVGATVIRSSLFEKSTRLRTDQAIVKKISHASFYQSFWNYLNPLCENSKCYSVYDPRYTYNLNQLHVPKMPFDRDVENDCVSGIHFYATKGDAKKY